MSFFRPKAAVRLSDFRNEFRDAARIVGYVGPSMGRPKKTPLGDVRSQITREVSARLATAMVEALETKGAVFEPAAQFLYDPSKRADWAASQITAMSTTNREAEDEDPFRLVEKMCGEFITIGSTRNPVTRRPEAVRITTACATPAELRIFADRQWTKSRRENALGEKFVKALRRVADHMADGERFDEAMARHYDDIRRGKTV